MPGGYLRSLPHVVMLTFLQTISDSTEASKSFKGSSKKETKLLIASCIEGVLGEKIVSYKKPEFAPTREKPKTKKRSKE